MQDFEQLSARTLAAVKLLVEMAQLELQPYLDLQPQHRIPSTTAPLILVDLSGRDTPMLTADNGRVLDAMEDLTADMLGLPETQRDRIRFDAAGFLAHQQNKIAGIARTAINHVDFTGTPHVFPPMNRRDRRLLESALHTSGLHFETLGQHATRWIILFPRDLDTRPERSEPERLITH